ncbi:hypothetical protein HPP92_017949 [Vanilla planifolia]|uniref:Uncharacterized protein n=1 Tax=Vanilla planifolia TaxID=51239 RepID=A0A835Q8W4_VANPL|nr:hypothetical protein HPP92_017949 [Vanilla planifolia]
MCPRGDCFLDSFFLFSFNKKLAFPCLFFYSGNGGLSPQFRLAGVRSPAAESVMMKSGVVEDGARQAKETLELAYQISNVLETGLDRHTLSLIISLLDRGVNPEPLSALVQLVCLK